MGSRYFCEFTIKYIPRRVRIHCITVIRTTRTHHVASLGGLSHLDLWALGQGGLGASMWARELCDHIGLYMGLGVPTEEEVLMENEVAGDFQVRGHGAVPSHL